MCIRDSVNTLTQLELALLDSAKFDDSICNYIARCSKLKVLDFTGLNTVTDEGLSSLIIEEKGGEGVTELVHLRLSGLNEITDEPTARFCGVNRGLQILELCKCSKLTAVGIEAIIRDAHCLKRININMIPKIKLESIKETIEQRSGLEILQFAVKNVSLADNGLRVSLPPVEKKKKKKKVKKAKK
eukprot:TRINITY_DN12795_c0_g3_i1.p2 TRINITY_DN12795_c0_g3~~TRINITY_DN12795_c0_g3_i1.p2  ORF type:complete len:201 (+),score=55.04 TRINITY_DN12795_c0_g3_i1:48-605(+)